MQQLENLGTWIPKIITERKDISQTSKLVYGIVHGFTSNGKDCWASNKTIGDWVGSEADTISTSISQLIEKGLIISIIEKEKGNARHLSTNPIGENADTYRRNRLYPIGENADTLSAKSPINNIYDNKSITNLKNEFGFKPITIIPQMFMTDLRERSISREVIGWLEDNYPAICELCRVQTFETGKDLMNVLVAMAGVYEQYGRNLPITLPEMLERAKSWRPKSENSKKNGLAGWIKGGLWLSASTTKKETMAEFNKRMQEEERAMGL